MQNEIMLQTLSVWHSLNLSRMDLDSMYLSNCQKVSWFDFEFLIDDWISTSSFWTSLLSWIFASTFRAFVSLCFFTRNLHKHYVKCNEQTPNGVWWTCLGVSGTKRAHRARAVPQRKCSDRVTLHPNAISLVTKVVTVPTWNKKNWARC